MIWIRPELGDSPKFRRASAAAQMIPNDPTTWGDRGSPTLCGIKIHLIWLVVGPPL